MSGTTTRGGRIGVSDSGLRLYPQSRRRVLPMGPAFEDETYWAGLIHEYELAA